LFLLYLSTVYVVARRNATDSFMLKTTTRRSASSRLYHNEL
jgi:hypothetical protein